jgi:hypothetical protein
MMLYRLGGARDSGGGTAPPRKLRRRLFRVAGRRVIRLNYDTTVISAVGAIGLMSTVQKRSPSSSALTAILIGYTLLPQLYLLTDGQQ